LISFIGVILHNRVSVVSPVLPGLPSPWRITLLMEVLRSLRTTDRPARQADWDTSSETQGVHQAAHTLFRLGAKNTSTRRHVNWEFSARAQGLARAIVSFG
jgi:hypothetical protein